MNTQFVQGIGDLGTTTEASAEENDPNVLITTTDTSIKEAEDTTSPSERL